MSFLDSLRTSASALQAQQLRLDVISNNIANAQTTRTKEGTPYQRQDVIFSTDDSKTGLPSFISALRGKTQSANSGGVVVSKIVTDPSTGSQVYDPSHPDADKNGYVTYPNVDPVVEMTNMLSATRSYEANLSVVDAVKRMALKALDIGK
jgi:flagellar basal-body rod protein FlgC